MGKGQSNDGDFDVTKFGAMPNTEIFQNVRFDYIKNSIVSDITSKDSKSFHFNVLGCKNLTFKHVNINAPQDSPNTDGIHIGRSVGINVINTKIGTGDDCISLGDGSQQESELRIAH
ncbi:hypothetical protein Csa_008659 [Cucumis sativus]|uniref:Polygalacturonase n=1 Tax=Cucumis sativus TaxID=3659 RepID=A0A0A0KQJ0_CUCSA|nr:hypothetical protein Csa_008659 [Cucumis sativus]